MTCGFSLAATAVGEREARENDAAALLPLSVALLVVACCCLFDPCCSCCNAARWRVLAAAVRPGVGCMAVDEWSGGRGRLLLLQPASPVEFVRMYGHSSSQR